MLITDEQIIQKQKEFEKLKIYQCFEEINRIIQFKIMNTCDNQISIYKLLKLICDISNGKNFFKINKTIQKNEIYKRSHQSNLISRCIQLSILPNQIGHLLGRDGQNHKKIMNDTNTRIHFDNAPYSINLSSNQSSEFNLDLFQSSDSLKATITGETIEAVENAIKELEELDRVTQV
jgi:hypothetical protein